MHLVMKWMFEHKELEFYLRLWEINLPESLGVLLKGLVFKAVLQKVDEVKKPNDLQTVNLRQCGSSASSAYLLTYPTHLSSGDKTEMLYFLNTSFIRMNLVFIIGRSCMALLF